MTWNWCAFGGGETRDALVDGWTDYSTGSVLMKNAAKMTVISTPVQTGTGALLLTPGDAGSGNAFAYTGQLVNLDAGQLTVVMGYVNLDALPSHKFRLIAHFGSGHDYTYTLDCDTDGRLQIGLYGAYSNLFEPTPISPKSVNTVGVAAYKHICWIIDPITHPGHVIHHVFIDFISEILFDAGVQPSYNVLAVLQFSDFVEPAGITATGSVVRLDDVAAAYSTTASDAPHITALPLALVDAQHPSSDTGATLNWTKTGAGTWCSHWDDAAGNDGDTTFLYSASTNAIQSSDMESAADLGWAAGATILEGGTGKGPAWVIVHRVAVAIGSKFTGWTYCIVGADLATAISVPKPGVDNYEGFGCRLTRPGGGSWGRPDLGNGYTGASTGASDHDMKWQVTLLMAQWAYTEANLPLAPVPMISQGIII